MLDFVNILLNWHCQLFSWYFAYLTLPLFFLQCKNGEVILAIDNILSSKLPFPHSYIPKEEPSIFPVIIWETLITQTLSLPGLWKKDQVKFGKCCKVQLPCGAEKSPSVLNGATAKKELVLLCLTRYFQMFWPEVNKFCQETDKEIF
jgi:hypothetical protein